jgi:hypothetical protein
MADDGICEVNAFFPSTRPSLALADDDGCLVFWHPWLKSSMHPSPAMADERC